MPVPKRHTPNHEKNHLERTLDDVVSNTVDGKITQCNMNRLTVAAEIQLGIDQYRAAA